MAETPGRIIKSLRIIKLTRIHTQEIGEVLIAFFEYSFYSIFK